MGFDLERLATVQLVPLTPFSADGATLLPELLGAFARSVYEAGIRVFLPAAGTGEFHSLTPAEVVSCVQAVHRAAGSDAGGRWLSANRRRSCPPGIRHHGRAARSQAIADSAA